MFKAFFTPKQKPGFNIALEEMCNAMTVFASNGDNRETLNDTLQDICVQHGHPFGNVEKTTANPVPVCDDTLMVTS